MAYRIHFSLDFERDFEKFEHIAKLLDRKCVEALAYLDHATWNRLKRTGDEYVVRWFDKRLELANAVVVLVGRQTYTRALVRYELSRAATRQCAMFGVNLHGLGNHDGATETAKGPSPFDYMAADNRHGQPRRYSIHNWTDERGPELFNDWLTDALRR